jgi:hypothetical protein
MRAARGTKGGFHGDVSACCFGDFGISVFRRPWRRYQRAAAASLSRLPDVSISPKAVFVAPCVFATHTVRAHEIRLERDGLRGNELNDWLEAEAEVGTDTLVTRKVRTPRGSQIVG